MKHVSTIAVILCAAFAQAAELDWTRKAFPLPESIWSVEAVDVNADGKLDLVAMGETKVFALVSPEWKQQILADTKEPKLLYCVALDADSDGDQDLFVCSGGNEFSANSTELISRLYINSGQGQFTKSPQLLPSAQIFESASCVSAADYDGDGDQDLFVGVRLKPFMYGYP